MEKYIIKKPKTFNLEHIFECGQCFRWNQNEDGSYTGIISNYENLGSYVIKVEEKEEKEESKKEDKEEKETIIIFTGKGKNVDKNLPKICNKYFDLDRDYESIKKQLSNIDNNLKKAINYGNGIRILNQDLWETILSYIISANNNIPRIKGIIERISKKYGEEIEFDNKKFYTFPTPKQLENAKIEDFKELGAGFRDKYLYDTTQKVLNKEIELQSLHNMDTKQCTKQLLKLKGIGPKVCDCILLFSTLKRFDVFPVDVWVRRVMNDLYFKKEKEETLSKNEITKYAKEKFGDLEGLAQQYLFYWRRSN